MVCGGGGISLDLKLDGWRIYPAWRDVCGQEKTYLRTRGTRRHVCATLVVLLASFFPLWCQAPRPRGAAQPADVSSLLREAQLALDHRDFAAAVKSLKSVLEAQPDSVPAWFNLAYAYSGLRQSEDAVHAYRKTLALQPDLFEARLNLGILLIEVKRAPEALEHLEKATELKPQNARAHLYYGRALLLAGRQDGAENQFQEALRLSPNLAIAHYDLGQVRLAQKRFEDANAAFEEAERLDPELAQAQLGMALAWEGLNRPAEAASHFEQYLARIPGDLETRFHLARIYLQQNENQKALENLQQVYRAYPDLPGVAAALGDTNALLKNFSESEKFYRQALTSPTGEPDLHRALGQTLLDERKFAGAEAEFRAALKLDPHNREAVKGLSSSLYLEKRWAEAIPLLEAQARAPDPPAAVFFVLATCYDNLRDRPKALEFYERYLELSQGRNPDQEWQARQRVKLLRRELGK